MGKKLIIVESPTKSNTIKKIIKDLGKDFDVVASYGHIRDLAKRKFSLKIDENGIFPLYVIPKEKRKIINELKKKIKNFETIILATDEDREGEAISWHLVETLNLKNYLRITFHEITRNAILEALKNPRKIDFALVNAQQARRILDRIVGYLVSPILWKKITKNLSAGRVQSAALRLIVEREREIENFKPQKYYEILALLKKEDIEFYATLFAIEDKKIGKFDLDLQKANEIKNKIEGKNLKVIQVKKIKVLRSPNPPFTTSTLTQQAWQNFKFPVKFTMSLAQELYEKGLITYMRTDSTHLASEAVNSIRKYIEENFKEFLPEKPRIYKTKSKLAQEAHEAIRPTDIFLTPDKINLEKNRLKLYEMIWKRTIACQMEDAVLQRTEAILELDSFKFKVTGQVLISPGFSLVDKVKFSESVIPDIFEGEELKVIKVKIEEHLTQPPARYNEGSLVKTLESYGIGRPSTYATIISTLFKRGYIERNKQKNLVPTELGKIVNDFLNEHFPTIVDYDFTAKIEEELDLIAQNKKDWQETLKNFYFPFSQLVEEKSKKIEKLIKTTEKNCPNCGGVLIEKFSKYGKFLACSNFPKCSYKESINTGVLCPKCGTGFLVKRKNKKNKIFYGCSRWPDCDFTTTDERGYNADERG
jgi:DNA topoisomerase-1